MILLAVRSFQIYNTKVLIFLTYYMYRFFDRTRWIYNFPCCWSWWIHNWGIRIWGSRRYSSHTRRLLTLRTTPRPLFNRLFIQIQCCYTVAHYCSRIRWRRWRRTAHRNWRRAKLVEPALTPPRLHSSNLVECSNRGKGTPPCTRVEPRSGRMYVELLPPSARARVLSSTPVSQRPGQSLRWWHRRIPCDVEY